MGLASVISLLCQIITLIGIVVTGVISISKVVNGQKCLLRSEMLRIYYRNRDKGEIKQYEFENFMLLYEAYKKLHGNSFIDKVCNEIRDLKVTY